MGADKQTFGARVQRARTGKKLKLREAAAKLGISPAYLSRIENDKEVRPPAEPVIKSMAELYQEEFDDLMQLAGRVAQDFKDMLNEDPKLPEFLRRVQQEGRTGGELLQMLDKDKKR